MGDRLHLLMYPFQGAQLSKVGLSLSFTLVTGSYFNQHTLNITFVGLPDRKGGNLSRNMDLDWKYGESSCLLPLILPYHVGGSHCASTSKPICRDSGDASRV